MLQFHRPFSWINSRIRVYDPLNSASSLANTSNTTIPGASEQSPQISTLPLSDMSIIGEAQSQWAPLKRKYNLFLFHQPPGETNAPTSTAGLDMSRAQKAQMAAQSSGTDVGQYVQFAYIEEPFLSWDFSLRSSSDKLIGSVNRNFAGFAREIFTDTGVYALRMDAAGLEEEAGKKHILSKTAQEVKEYKDVVVGEKGEMGMTLDQRAVMLATAVTVDYDYFSRHSHSGRMGWMPLLIGGGGTAEGGAGEAAAGAAVGGAGRAVGGAVGVEEGAIAGAGLIAGYEAMQRVVGGQSPQQPPPMDDASPQAPQQGGGPDGRGGHGEGAGKGEDNWGQDGQDPWTGQGGGGGGGDGGGLGVSDIFGD